jgi:hypothetical protein
MQLNIIVLLAAISTAVSAAPVDGGVSPAIMDNALVARTSPPAEYCCKKGKEEKCKRCDSKLSYICLSCSRN